MVCAPVDANLRRLISLCTSRAFGSIVYASTCCPSASTVMPCGSFVTGLASSISARIAAIVACVVPHAPHAPRLATSQSSAPARSSGRVSAIAKAWLASPVTSTSSELP